MVSALPRRRQRQGKEKEAGGALGKVPIISSLPVPYVCSQRRMPIALTIISPALYLAEFSVMNK